MASDSIGTGEGGEGKERREMKKVIFVVLAIIALSWGVAWAEDKVTFSDIIELGTISSSGVSCFISEPNYLVIHAPDPKGYWDKNKGYRNASIESLICHSSHGNTIEYHWFSSEYDVVRYLNGFEIEPSYQTKIYKIEEANLKYEYEGKKKWKEVSE